MWDGQEITRIKKTIKAYDVKKYCRIILLNLGKIRVKGFR